MKRLRAEVKVVILRLPGFVPDVTRMHQMTNGPTLNILSERQLDNLKWFKTKLER